MKKGLLIVITALLAVYGGTAWAVDVNPWQAKCNSTSGQPSAAVSGDQVKALWSAAVWLNNSQKTYISTDDGNIYDHSGAYTWHWIMVKLAHSAKAHNFTGHWEAHTDAYSDYPMYVYVWDNAGQNWDWKDTGPQSIFTTARNFTIAPGYWNWDPDCGESGAYVCLILVQGRTYSGARNVHVDVVDANY